MAPERRRLILLLLFSAGVVALSSCGSGSGSTPAPAPAPAVVAPFGFGCDASVGLQGPLTVCSPSNPCTLPAPELNLAVIASSSDAPVCRTRAAGRPVFDDGPPLTSIDAGGVPRYACQFTPAGASAQSLRPLVVFMHGGGGAADNAYDSTLLRQKATNYDLTGDVARPGFHLLAVQGRNLHYPTYNARDARHHDFYFRDLRSPSANPDVVNLDRLIDALVAGGSVDPTRIYVIGWSNGGFFGQMYAMARHVTPTPGGNRIAAVMPFTAADPFHNINSAQSPSCQLNPYPRSTVPTYLISRSCDLVACDAAQAASLTAQGNETLQGHIVSVWATDLNARVGNPNVSRRIVNGVGQAVQACTPANLCTPALAIVNHVRWPDGVADNSGIDHEPDILNFLRANPRP